MIKKNPIYNPKTLQDVISIIPDLSFDGERLRQIEDYQNHFEANKEALSEKNFPSPSYDSQEEYANNKKALKYVNLNQIIVRTWQAILCGDNVIRNIISSPYKDIVENCIKDFNYIDIQSAWVESAMVSGTQVVVPIYNQEDKDFSFWLPNPSCTEIITNPTNVYDVLAVIEKTEHFVQFISKFGEGIIFEDGTGEINERNYSYLPVAIGYGKSQLHTKRCIYGRSMISEAVDSSIKHTNAAFNVSILGKQQTRDILKIIGPLEKLSMYDDMELGLSTSGLLVLPEGFDDVGFMSPNPKINESISILNMESSLFAKTSGLPLDIIAPEMVQNASAESARIRSLPLMHMAKQVVPRWLDYEKKLILAMIYLIEYFESNESYITLSSIKQRSDIELENTYNILPSSPNERTANNIALVAAGIKPIEDAIREEKPNITDEELAEMLVAYDEKLKSGNPKAIEQEAFKAANDTFTEEQKKEKDNK